MRTAKEPISAIINDDSIQRLKIDLKLFIDDLEEHKKHFSKYSEQIASIGKKFTALSRIQKSSSIYAELCTIVILLNNLLTNMSDTIFRTKVLSSISRDAITKHMNLTDKVIKLTETEIIHNDTKRSKPISAIALDIDKEEAKDTTTSIRIEGLGYDVSHKINLFRTMDHVKLLLQNSICQNALQLFKEIRVLFDEHAPVFLKKDGSASKKEHMPIVIEEEFKANAPDSRQLIISHNKFEKILDDIEKLKTSWPVFFTSNQMRNNDIDTFLEGHREIIKDIGLTNIGNETFLSFIDDTIKNLGEKIHLPYSFWELFKKGIEFKEGALSRLTTKLEHQESTALSNHRSEHKVLARLKGAAESKETYQKLKEDLNTAGEIFCKPALELRKKAEDPGIINKYPNLSEAQRFVQLYVGESDIKYKQFLLFMQPKIENKSHDAQNNATRN